MNCCDYEHETLPRGLKIQHLQPNSRQEEEDSGFNVWNVIFTIRGYLSSVKGAGTHPARQSLR